MGSDCISSWSLLIFLLYGIPTWPSASIMAQNIQLFGPREGFLTHQWIITGNKLITVKYYDEAKMRTRQERVATDTWRSLGCRTTPLEHWSKRKPTVEPRWAKQQTKKPRPKPTKTNSPTPGGVMSLCLLPTNRRPIHICADATMSERRGNKQMNW